MTMKEKMVKAWNDIKCSYGNHEWGEYLVDAYGLYHYLYTRKCKHCSLIEASTKPFKHKTMLEVKDAKIYNHEVR